MKRSRFSEEQIIGILREAEAGSPIKAVCAAHNISTASFHAWKRKFGGMEVSEAKRPRALEEENSRLKRLVADQAVQIHILKESTQKSGEPVCKTTGCEDECARRLGESGSELSGAGTLEIELLSQRPIEPGKPAHPQGSAGVERQASSLWLSAHYGANATRRLRGQWETSGADSTRRRSQGDQEATTHEAIRHFDGRATAR